ncbi:MAG: hypothetical protein AMXMBFR59_25910 [Rhodanobacteraceae bacterium]
MERFHIPASSRYPFALLLTFGAWWLLLGVSPWYRQDWLLENVLVVIAIPLLVWAHGRLRVSNAAYTCLFVFLCLHEIGAHFTYSEVPLPEWLGNLLNLQTSGLPRNHFDRLVHFLYGLLIAPLAVELLDARAPQRGPLWRFLIPWLFVVSHATLFEIVEASAAVLFGGDLGEAYLGTQGDSWDSQKDSALAAIGAVIGVALHRRFAGNRSPTDQAS